MFSDFIIKIRTEVKTSIEIIVNIMYLSIKIGLIKKLNKIGKK